MALTLNGTSQYVSLGNGVNVLSTLPITLAAVVQSASISAGLKGLYSQGQYTANRGWGIFAYDGPPKKLGAYGASSGGATTEFDGSTELIAANNGWYLCLATIRNNSGTFEVSLSTYSYASASWIGTNTIGSGSTSGTLQAIDAGDTTVVCAADIAGSVGNHWPTTYSWIAIFDQDYSTNPSANANALELVANGAWNLLNSHCKLFIPFRNATTDESGNGHNGTLVGSPSYTTAGPGEEPPASSGTIIRINFSGQIQILTGGIDG